MSWFRKLCVTWFGTRSFFHYIKDFYAPRGKMNITLSLTPKGYADILQLCTDTDCTILELVRVLLASHKCLQDTLADGGKIILRSADGKETSLPSDWFYKWGKE